ALPFRDGVLGGAWARMSYQHLPKAELPMALAHLHWASVVGAPFRLAVLRGDHEGHDLPGDDFPGRFFAGWDHEALADAITGAGFEIQAINDDGDITWVDSTRRLSLPDTVAPGMGLLVCGLNPSIYSAERGVGYARPGNRFWPAAIAAGIVSRDRDPRHALVAHGVGLTDLVKRPTVAAAELSVEEYRSGVARVERLTARFQPDAICFVGLDGWRKAIDRKATPGWQPEPFGGVPAYLMPSTSGLNARTSLDALTAHLRSASHEGEANPGGATSPGG
ncbi:MAG TPA: mismatch-specific DNA-glycosylase, partial [Acidimicrobiales bacterium]|nr:mismatch-specific DNA-glycosylase [Acidimicrobiales bacterium]